MSDDEDEPSLLRLDLDEKLRLNDQDSIVLSSFSTLPKTIIELPTKSFIDKKLNGPSTIRNTALVDLNNENLDNVRFC